MYTKIIKSLILAIFISISIANVCHAYTIRIWPFYYIEEQQTCPCGVVYTWWGYECADCVNYYYPYPGLTWWVGGYHHHHHWYGGGGGGGYGGMHFGGHRGGGHIGGVRALTHGGGGHPGGHPGGGGGVRHGGTHRK